MLQVAIAKNMRRYVQRHFLKAGLRIAFEDGTDHGRINSNGNIVDGLRSYDIPIDVMDKTYDVGLCGSDWVEEHRLGFNIHPAILGRYTYGRRSLIRPTLDFVASNEDPIFRVEDIKPGSIVRTEHPILTKLFLEERGHQVATLGQIPDGPSPEDFRDWCRERGMVGVRIVHGAIATSVSKSESNNGCYGIMVNEKSETAMNHNLMVVETLLTIDNLLIANPKLLDDKEKGPELEMLCQSLERGYASFRRNLEAPNYRSGDRRH